MALGCAGGRLALFVAFDLWLLMARGTMSAELVYWEAQRRLLRARLRRGSTCCVTSDQPLVWIPPRWRACASSHAAIAGMASVALGLVRHGGGGRRHRSAPRRWLLPLVLTLTHPAILLSAAQYPHASLRALLVLSCVSWLLAVRGGRLNQRVFLIAAASLAGLGLLEPAPWPSWLYLAVALIASAPRGRAEQTARVLMLLFPWSSSQPAGLILSGLVGGSLGWCKPTGLAARNLRLMRIAQASIPTASYRRVDALTSGLGSLWVFAPAALLLSAWAIGRELVAGCEGGQAWQGSCWRRSRNRSHGRGRQEAVAPPPLDVMLPLLALPLLASYAWIRPDGWVGWVSTSIVLALGLVLAWASLLLAPVGIRLRVDPEQRP